MALYTATFSLGMSASFWVSGQLAARFGWRAAFFASASGAAAALLVAASVLRPRAVTRGAGEAGAGRLLAVLDAIGGGRTVVSWGAAFAAMGLGASLGPLFLRRAEEGRATLSR